MSARIRHGCAVAGLAGGRWLVAEAAAGAAEAKCGRPGGGLTATVGSGATAVGGHSSASPTCDDAPALARVIGH